MIIFILNAFILKQYTVDFKIDLFEDTGYMVLHERH